VGQVNYPMDTQSFHIPNDYGSIVITLVSSTDLHTQKQKARGLSHYQSTSKSWSLHERIRFVHAHVINQSFNRIGERFQLLDLHVMASIWVNEIPYIAIFPRLSLSSVMFSYRIYIRLLAVYKYSFLVHFDLVRCHFAYSARHRFVVNYNLYKNYPTCKANNIVIYHTFDLLAASFF